MTHRELPNPLLPEDDGLLHEAAMYLDGELPDDQARSFEQCLIEDQRCRKLVVRFAFERELLSESLRPEGADVFSTPDSHDESHDEEGSEILQEVIDLALANRRKHDAEVEIRRQQLSRQDKACRVLKPVPTHARRRVIVIPRWVVALAAVVLIAFVWGVAWQSERNSKGTQEAVEAPSLQAIVGRIVRHSGASWEDGTPITTGEPLYNRGYALAEGIVEIMLDNDVRLVIEGPSRIDLAGTDRIHLHSGRLYGDVPPMARGFAVESPDAMVIDLGTEFSLDTTSRHGTLVQVFSGQVSVAPKSGTRSTTPTMMFAGSAYHVYAEQMVSVPFEPQTIIREMPSGYDQAVRSLKPLCWWSFNRARDGAIQNRAEDHSHLSAEGDPILVDAPNDRAIHFDEDTRPLIADSTRAARLSSGFTLEAWVRIEGAGAQSARILSSRDNTQNRGGYGFGLVGELHANDYICSDVDGQPFRCHPRSLKLTYFELFDVVSEEPVPTGRWVQVIATCPADSPVQLYINGSRVRTGVNTQSAGKDSVALWLRPSPAVSSTGPLMIGGNPGLEEVEPFSGQIDEVVIYDTVLSDRMITELYRRATQHRQDQ